jgi:hypothetical protein
VQEYTFLLFISKKDIRIKFTIQGIITVKQKVTVGNIEKFRVKKNPLQK